MIPHKPNIPKPKPPSSGVEDLEEKSISDKFIGRGGALFQSFVAGLGSDIIVNKHKSNVKQHLSFVEQQEEELKVQTRNQHIQRVKTNSNNKISKNDPKLSTHFITNDGTLIPKPPTHRTNDNSHNNDLSTISIQRTEATRRFSLNADAINNQLALFTSNPNQYSSSDEDDEYDQDNDQNYNHNPDDTDNFTSTAKTTSSKPPNFLLSHQVRRKYGLKSMKQIMKQLELPIKNSNINNHNDVFADNSRNTNQYDQLTTGQLLTELHKNRKSYPVESYQQSGAFHASEYWPTQGYSYNVNILENHHTNNEEKIDAQTEVIAKPNSNSGSLTARNRPKSAYSASKSGSQSHRSSHSTISNNKGAHPKSYHNQVKQYAEKAFFISLVSETSDHKPKNLVETQHFAPILSDAEIDKILAKKIAASTRKGFVRNTKELITAKGIPKLRMNDMIDIYGGIDGMQYYQEKQGHTYNALSEPIYAELGAKIIKSKQHAFVRPFSATSYKNARQPDSRLQQAFNRYNIDNVPPIGSYNLEKYENYMKKSIPVPILPVQVEAIPVPTINSAVTLEDLEHSIPRDFDKNSQYGKRGITIPTPRNKPVFDNDLPVFRKNFMDPISSIGNGKLVTIPKSGLNSRTNANTSSAVVVDKPKPKGVQYSLLKSQGPEANFKIHLANKSGPAVTFGNEIRTLAETNIRERYRQNEIRQQRIKQQKLKQRQEFMEWKSIQNKENNNERYSEQFDVTEFNKYLLWLQTNEGKLYRAQKQKQENERLKLLQQQREALHIQKSPLFDSNTELRLKDKRQLSLLQQKAWLSIVTHFSRIQFWKNVINQLTIKATNNNNINSLIVIFTRRLELTVLHCYNHWRRYCKRRKQNRAASILQRFFRRIKYIKLLHKARKAGSIIHIFLYKVSKFDRMKKYISMYRMKIIKLQRFWRRCRLIIEARKEFLLRMWNFTIEQRVDELLIYRNLYLKRIKPNSKSVTINSNNSGNNSKSYSSNQSKFAYSKIQSQFQSNIQSTYVSRPESPKANDYHDNNSNIYSNNSVVSSSGSVVFHMPKSSNNQSQQTAIQTGFGIHRNRKKYFLKHQYENIKKLILDMVYRKRTELNITTTVGNNSNNSGTGSKYYTIQHGLPLLKCSVWYHFVCCDSMEDVIMEALASQRGVVNNNGVILTRAEFTLWFTANQYSSNIQTPRNY